MSKEKIIAVEFCLRYFTARVYGYYIWGFTERGEEYRELYYTKTKNDASMHSDIRNVITDELMSQSYDYQQLLNVLQSGQALSLIREYLHAIAVSGPIKETDIDIRRFTAYDRLYLTILDALKGKSESLKHKLFIFAVEREIVATELYTLIKTDHFKSEELKLILNPMFSDWQIVGIVNGMIGGLTAEELSVVARPDLDRDYMDYAINWLKLYRAKYTVDNNTIHLFDKLISNGIDYGWSYSQWTAVNYMMEEFVLTDNQKKMHQKLLQLINNQDRLTEEVADKVLQNIEQGNDEEVVRWYRSFLDDMGKGFKSTGRTLGSNP